MESTSSSLDNSSLAPFICNDSYISPDWLHTAIPAIIYIISAVGIALNLLVLMVFLLHKKACTSTEIYLSNMAAADLFLCVLLPFWGKNVSNKNIWTFGEPLCKTVTLFIVMNYSCSIYFLVLVCVDRFMALVYPLSACKLRRQKYAKMSCMVMWCFSFLQNIPTLLCRKTISVYLQNKEQRPSSGEDSFTCAWKCSVTTYTAVNIAQSVISFLIPLMIISFCSVKILQALNQRPDKGVTDPKSERKVTILVLAVLLAFLICWIPHRVHKMIEIAIRLGMIEETCKFVMIIEVCQHLFMYLAFFNSCLNPVLYVIVAQAFRKKMWEVLFQGGKERDSRGLYTTNNTMSHQLM